MHQRPQAISPRLGRASPTCPARHLLSAALPLIAIAFSSCTTMEAPLAGVQASPVESEPTQLPAISPSPTTPPPPAPDPTLTSELALRPEVPATAVEQLIGSWAIHNKPEESAPELTLTFHPDGTYQTVATAGFMEGSIWEAGTYRLDNGSLTLVSDWCDTSLGGTYTCTATYEVSVAMADGRPGALHFVAVEDPQSDRLRYLPGTKFPASDTE